MEVGNIVGAELVRALVGELTVHEALRNAERGVEALGTPG
jgi:hypothetical protein